MILETIVTSQDAAGAAGAVNFAPMGVEWGEDELVLKPYRETTTFANLVATGQAVVNLVDDILLFAQAVISSPVFPSHPAVVVHGRVLDAACSWREVEVREADTSGARGRFTCAVVHRGFQREFLGFNRARNAVLEAAILATRTRMLPIEEILAEYERLRVPVDKTAGPREREAFALLSEYVQREAAALQEVGS